MKGPKKKVPVLQEEESSLYTHVLVFNIFCYVSAFYCPKFVSESANGISHPLLNLNHMWKGKFRKKSFIQSTISLHMSMT